MKIHSKFRDYYDSAMAHGVDDNVHYVRTESEVRVGTIPAAKQHLQMSGNHRKVDYVPDHDFLSTDMFKERPGGRRTVSFGRRVRYSQPAAPDRSIVFIGFCGRVYAGIQFQWPDKYDETVTRTAYDTAGIIKALREYDKKFKTKCTKHFIEDREKHNPDNWNAFTPFNEKAMDIYFKKYANYENVNYFVELDSPLFVITGDGTDRTIHLNAPLVDHEFQKVLDPFTAYQEIAMFMGGVLAELDEIDVPGVSDKDLKAGKGFDKWSFKTMPTKHKKGK